MESLTHNKYTRGRHGLAVNKSGNSPYKALSTATEVHHSNSTAAAAATGWAEIMLQKINVCTRDKESARKMEFVHALIGL